MLNVHSSDSFYINHEIIVNLLEVFLFCKIINSDVNLLDECRIQLDIFKQFLKLSYVKISPLV